MKSRKIVSVHTCGGLGNQLFQFAAAFSLARNINAVMQVDTHTGFAADKEFKRKFVLHSFLDGQSIKPCSPFSRFSFKLLFLASKILNRLNLLAQHSLISANSIVDNRLGPFILVQEAFPSFSCLKSVACRKQFIFLHGYWQSHHYFESHKTILYEHILQGLELSQSAEPFLKTLRQRPTLALGLRLYEEAASPELNAYRGQLKSINDVQTALKHFILQNPDVQIAVFCTHRSSLLNELNLPASTIFLTGDDGVVSAADTLLLMMNCQHHLFLNSSLYWWAAWLSEMNPIHEYRSQTIIAADNFINQDCYLDHWLKF